MAYGKSIELFLANGTADSLIIAELSNWNGKAIKIPRIEVADCKRDDINGAGVYFLFCKEEDDTDFVYIGESETVQDRLIQHIRDYNAEKEKFYWTTAVIFLGRDLNKALIRYLEDRFVQIARECKRYNVLTKNTYSRTVIKEAHIAAMEEFIDNVRVLINALGYKSKISSKTVDNAIDSIVSFVHSEIDSSNLSDNDKEKEKNSYKHFAKSLGKILKENLQVAQQLI